MVAGLPVIVSPNVGAKDLVKEGSNRFILPFSEDEDAVADRIAQLTNRELWEAIGGVAAQTASTHDWKELAKNMERLYQEVFPTRPSVPKESCV